VKNRLPFDTIRRIDNILRRAHQQGRGMLFEHEVYAILGALGLKTPNHWLVKEAAGVTPQLLAQFGSNRVVLKVVADHVAHKQAMGGVRIVYKEVEFVRYSFERLLYDFAAAGVAVSGILFVEAVEHSQDLGNEILLGFRESETFGPVISFSKGGADAEHFARHFSPPNLILAPIDRQWAQALLESTHIHEKYVQQGKQGYADKIVEAGVKFSDLSLDYSHFFPSRSEYVLTEFEVNPFVFTPDHRLMALDGFARFVKREGAAPDRSLLPKESITPFFEPEGIAVLGVSTSDDTKTGNTVLNNLSKLGRADLFAVNPKGGSVAAAGRNIPVHRSLTEIGRPIDLAIVTVPAEAALTVVHECAAVGVKAIILIPGGFGEIDRHRDVEAEILALAREKNFRVMGPNCLGIICAGSSKERSMNTFFVPEEKFGIDFDSRANVAILSQSGALGIIEIENLKNALSPKVIVSYGNQLDVDPCDLVNYFQDDPQVRVIACYIEGFKPGAGRKFFEIASRGRKPVIVYKAGRTQAGRKATESHTASIAGEYAVAQAAMKQAGLIVADTMIDHGDFIKIFALWNDFTVNGNRVAIIANAGYEKTAAADRLDDLVPAELDSETLDQLRRMLPSIVRPDALLDLTPMADEDMFEGCIETILRSPAVDALLISIVPHSRLIGTTDAELAENPDNIATRIIRLAHRYRKPTAVSVNVVSRAGALYNVLSKTLDAGGVPTFLTADRAMFCLNTFIRYRLLRRAGLKAEWLKQ
jgi:acyl-CoA synthetase (NDP forming)